MSKPVLSKRYAKLAKICIIINGPCRSAICVLRNPDSDSNRAVLHKGWKSFGIKEYKVALTCRISSASSARVLNPLAESIPDERGWRVSNPILNRPFYSLTKLRLPLTSTRESVLRRGRPPAARSCRGMIARAWLMQFRDRDIARVNPRSCNPRIGQSTRSHLRRSY